MQLLTLLAEADVDAGLDAPKRSPAVNMAAKGSHPPPDKKVKRQSDRERDIPPDDRDAEEDGVTGEVEQPAPPSEKPEAP